MKDLILTPISLKELVNAISIEVTQIISKNEDLKISNQNCKVDEFLTRKETAELCKVKSLTTLWNWEQKGMLVPTMNAGQKPLYKREDVNSFLKRKDSG